MPKVKRCWPVCTSVPTMPSETPNTTMPIDLITEPCASTAEQRNGICATEAAPRAWRASAAVCGGIERRGSSFRIPESAVEAVIRLTDMGVAPYLAADALAGVVSQRLVRCRRSDGSYQGRFCLCEVVPAGRRLRDAIRRCAGVRDLTDAARSDGAVLLPDVIARTLAAGRTDEREIRRVCEGGSSW